MRKSKKGVSAVVGYVLLITITLSLSVFVYNWLRLYVSDNNVEECSENVNIIIDDYECHSRILDCGTDPCTIIEEGNISITLKNKGLFSVDGYRISFHDDPDADFGIYNLNETGVPLAPGESINHTYRFEDITDYDGPSFLRRITLLDVQPFRNDDEGQISCQTYVTQRVAC